MVSHTSYQKYMHSKEWHYKVQNIEKHAEDNLLFANYISDNLWHIVYATIAKQPIANHPDLPSWTRNLGLCPEAQPLTTLTYTTNCIQIKPKLRSKENNMLVKKNFLYCNYYVSELHDTILLSITSMTTITQTCSGSLICKSYF
jgi:hypothetical protein